MTAAMSGQRPSTPVLSLFSARPDGATTVAVGLAAVLTPSRRVLVVDRSFPRPEVAALLDLEERPGLYELAYRSRLAPVSRDELEAHVQWRDGIGVLAGITAKEHADEITPHFIDALVSAVTTSFDCAILDLGRPSTAIPAALTAGRLIWVVDPSPLGMWALDRRFRRLESAGAPWLRSSEIVLNQVDEWRFLGLDRFISYRYGLRVVGELPLAPQYWRRVAWEHSVRALGSPLADGERYRRSYGVQAEQTRGAMRRLADTLVDERSAARRVARG